MSVSQKVIEAMDILTNVAISKANFDKTIQAQILSCEDADSGKYRCRYQDATFIAYASSDIDTIYQNGTNVYILIPRNDMSNQKTILGTTKSLGDNYQKTGIIQDTLSYKTVGENCITSDEVYTLDSNIKEYNWDIVNTDYLTIDASLLNKYITSEGVDALKFSASIKTEIPPERRAQGNYGIAFALKFYDNNQHKEKIRLYSMDISTMEGDPYHYPYFTEQKQYYPIEDGFNFIDIESIQLFCYGFYDAAASAPTTGHLNSGDIWIKDLSIQCASRLSEDQINGITIQFDAPNGTIFKQGATESDYKTITAKIKVKNRPAGKNTKFDFYWGIEDVNVTQKNSSYNQILGRGWKCLNKFNTIKKATSNKEAVVEWVPAQATYKVSFKDAPAKDNKFKVALQYKGKVYSAEINIQNLTSSGIDLRIISDSGTKFYYDIGHPTLTCLVNNSSSPNGYIFKWVYESNTGAITQLPATTDLNHAYTQASTALSTLERQIANGEKFANAQAENLKQKKAAVAAFDNIQRVSYNKIYNFQTKVITEFGILKCSVTTTTKKYIGTAIIRLVNLLKPDGSYSLVINNGAAAFQYNQNGIAPTSSKLENKQQIQKLSFSIYDNLGNQISDQTLSKQQNCEAYWYCPKSNTLLTTKDQTKTSQDEEYNIFNQLTLKYGIAENYDIKKQHNQIKLIVQYKGMRLVAETAFSFVKQGQPGTNGTEYIVKLVPNTNADDPPLYPMITKVGQENNTFKYYLNYTKQQSGGPNQEQQIDITGPNGYKFIKAQLWKSGILIWEGASSITPSKDEETQPSSVVWEILKNKYASNIEDFSDFQMIDSGNGTIKYNGTDVSKAQASIIKCSITYQGKIYYGTIPFTVAYAKNENYRVSLKDYTGFRYAIYSSDGMTPQYDSATPFEFICKEKINNYWEDISLDNNNHIITYEVSPLGSEWQYDNQTQTYQEVETNLLEILQSSYYREGCNKNQWRCRPKSRYNGLSVNTSICCTFKHSGETIGRINVPIHYLLNRYGLAQLNEWDGNSIKIDNEGGYILSPQIGAGKKDENNAFTGVLMGEVKEANKKVSNTGLFGYSQGQRSFFLNSENGSAIFGKDTTNGGQIIIDPTANAALLYSNSYYNQYDENTGLPSNYSDSNKSGKGMLINLSNPLIHLAGQDGQNAKIYSHSKTTINNNTTGFYISQEGISLGAKFKVTNEGILTLGAGAVAGPTSNPNHWTIDGSSTASYIAFNATSFASTNANQVYIGTDGIKLGTGFSVTNSGNLTAQSGYIGGWSIDQYGLSHNNISINANTGVISGGTAGGYAWTLNNTGTAVFNNITANGGSIGGWTINTNNLSNNGITLSSSGIDLTGLHLNANGSITTGSISYPWSIAVDGKATFSNIDASGTVNANGGEIGGWQINAASGSFPSSLSGTNQSQGQSLYLYSDGRMNTARSVTYAQAPMLIENNKVNLIGLFDQVYDPTLPINLYPGYKATLRDYIQAIINGY